jgi:hypothetical protein
MRVCKAKKLLRFSKAVVAADYRQAVAGETV